MAYNIKSAKRVFIFEKANNKITLDDPDINMSPEEVQRFYTNVHPELALAKITGPDLKKDCMEFTFGIKVGTHG